MKKKDELAQDATAPRTILNWMGVNFNSLSEDKLREAFECCIEMKKFQNRKLPD